MESGGFSDVELKRIRQAVADFDMPTSEHWRGIMARARKEMGLTQGQLGTAVGTSQPNISDIENGKTGGSAYVPAICVALGIPLPIIFIQDDFDERWVDVGRLLRAKSMKRFHQYLALFEDEAGIEESTEDQGQVIESPHGRERPTPTAKPDRAG